jgi:alkylated DNA nucleotide flippase Atl1
VVPVTARSTGEGGSGGAGDWWPDYVEAVLDVVETVPQGRVATYGDVAAAVAAAPGPTAGRGGPRVVGRALATAGDAAPWWRVVAASGRVHGAEAAARLADEGVLVVDGRVVGFRDRRVTPRSHR